MKPYFPAIFCGAAVAVSLLSSCTSRDGRTPLYKDPSAAIEDRVEDLLSRMTPEEKAAQLQNLFVTGPDSLEAAFGGIGTGTVHNLYLDAATCKETMDSVQSYLLGHTRLGIPAITCVEGIQGILEDGCTIFPHALAQGSTFNPELIRKMSSAMAEEARYLGLHQILAPVLDIPRDLRWGRVQETYGEDPYLISEMAVNFVRGYQEKGDITCTPKHFVAHGSPVGGLNTGSVSGGERELRSMYLYPFRRVIGETHPYCVMSCYSTYDGVPVTASRYYMTDILRGELGFDGYAYSDWGAVERLVDFHWAAKDLSEAARMALYAGIDLNVFWAYGTLLDQMKAGGIDMDTVDEAVRRVLRTKFRLGLFEDPFSKGENCIRSSRHEALSDEVADESAILLENNGILPLDLTKYRRIAVVGPLGDRTVFGDYSWTRPGHSEGVTLYQGLSQLAPKGVSVRYSEGCDWWSQDGSKIAQAVSLARSSDVVIVAVGSMSTFLARDPVLSTDGEGYDLSTLELPGRQNDLLKALKAAGKPIIAVLISGKPFVMNWAKDNAEAFLVQWYCGENQGLSLAEILVGEVNPSGRLNVSFPRSTGASPCYYNYLPTDKDYYTNYGGTPEKPHTRYIFEPAYAMWNFGAGLSYTTFEYRDMTMEKETFTSPSDTMKVSVVVENTGDMDGKEVVQLYVRDVIASVATPIRQLKAFRKVFIPSGGKVTVELSVPLSELALYDQDMKCVVEPGDFEIQVGHASDDIRLRRTVSYQPK